MIYALIALGYSLVYGILELINFAHGDVFMLGGMMTVTLVSAFGLGASGNVLVWIIPMLAITAVFTGFLNTTIETVAYRPLRNAPRLAPLITAIGVSFILQTVGLVWKGPAPVSIRDDILPNSEIFSIGEASMTWNQLIVFVVTIPTLLALVWLVQRTKSGKAMRAVAQDKDAAAMMGIDVNRTISFTFLTAGCLAGFAGVLYALFATNVQFDTGFRLGLFAFTAAVIGGIGNLPGAVLGAILIGLIENFNDGLTQVHARIRLEVDDHLRDPDPHPRLPSRGPPRRADARGRLMPGRFHVASEVGSAWWRGLSYVRHHAGALPRACPAGSSGWASSPSPA